MAFIPANEAIRFSDSTHSKDLRNVVNSGDHLLEYIDSCSSSEAENKDITVVVLFH